MCKSTQGHLLRVSVTEAHEAHNLIDWVQFPDPLPSYGKLVQSVEHGPVKSGVEGSSPSFPVKSRSNRAMLARLTNKEVSGVCPVVEIELLSK